jgi:hypothetical protein
VVSNIPAGTVIIAVPLDAIVEHHIAAILSQYAAFND